MAKRATLTQEYPSDLVSIITPSYNSEKFISETIESVINQTYPNWEMIIIDDQSTDKSCDIVEKYSADDPRIRLIKSEVNQGPALSRNTGIKESRGRYIAFLDSDDIWAKKKLELQIENLNRSEHSISFPPVAIRIWHSGMKNGSAGSPVRITTRMNFPRGYLPGLRRIRRATTTPTGYPVIRRT